MISPPKPKPVATTPKRVHRREPDDAEFADKVVEAAVDEALMHYRYPTAWALRSLYDERSGDSEFVAMIEDVFKQRADTETMDEFARLIELKKREGKKDDQGCYYFVPHLRIADSLRISPRLPHMPGSCFITPTTTKARCEPPREAKLLMPTTLRAARRWQTGPNRMATACERRRVGVIDGTRALASHPCPQR